MPGGNQTGLPPFAQGCPGVPNGNLVANDGRRPMIDEFGIGDSSKMHP